MITEHFVSMCQFEKATTTAGLISTQQFECKTRDLKQEANNLKAELNEANKTIVEFKDIRYKLETQIERMRKEKEDKIKEMESFRLENQKVIDLMKSEIKRLEFENQTKLDKILLLSQKPK